MDTIVNSTYSNIVASEVYTPVRPQVLTHAWNINNSCNRNFAETGGQTVSSFNDTSPQSSHYLLPAIQYVEAYEIETENYDENEMQIESDTQLHPTEPLVDSTDTPTSNHVDGVDIQDDPNRSNEVESRLHDVDNINTIRGRVGSPYRGRERGSDSGSGSNRRNHPNAVYSERTGCTGQLPVAEAFQDPSVKTLEESQTSLPPIQDTTPLPPLPLSTAVFEEPPPVSLPLTLSMNLTLIPQSEPSSPLHLPTVPQSLAESLTPSHSSSALTLLAPPVSTSSPSIPTLTEAISLNLEVHDPSSLRSSSPSSSSLRSIRQDGNLTVEDGRVDAMEILDQPDMSRFQTSRPRSSEMTSTWLIFVSLLFVSGMIAIFGISAVTVRTNNGIGFNGFQPILRNYENNLFPIRNSNNLLIENNRILSEMDVTAALSSGILLVENDRQGIELSSYTDSHLSSSMHNEQEIHIITESHSENDENEYSRIDGIEGLSTSGLNYNEFVTEIVTGNYDRISIDDVTVSSDDSFADDTTVSENNILNGETIEEHVFGMFQEVVLRNEEIERSRNMGIEALNYINIDIDIDSVDTVLDSHQRVESTREEEGVQVTSDQISNENESDNEIENNDLWISVRGFMVQVLSTFRHLHDSDSASDGMLYYPDFCSDMI